jgi:hypothetical protein
MGWALGKKRLEEFKIHASETAWVGTRFDHVLTNDGSIDDLFHKIKNLVGDRPDAIDPHLFESLQRN